MKRKFQLTLSFKDEEGPNEDTETSIKALKDFIMEALGELAFDDVSLKIISLPTE